MESRRGFLRQAATVAGAAALGDLAAARDAVAAHIRHVPPLTAADAPFPALRDRYLLDPDVIYLNHASIGTIPRVVHDARARYLALCETNPWLYMWGGEWEEPRETVRGLAAASLGCEPSEVAFTHNTTEGFNLLAHGLPLGRGDEIVFSSLNHDGASVCWNHLAPARGFTVRRFDFPVRDVPDLTAGDVVALYERHLTDRTRVLVLPHVDNVVGLRHPIRALADLARARGVEFVAVDGAQTSGMLPIDVRAMGVDFYAASPHKWLQAPKGLGLLYTRAALRERLRPMWVTWGQERWRGSARIFEDYGTRNLPELIALGDAIAFQQQLGTAAKEARYHTLWNHARARVDASDRLVWRSPVDWNLAASLYAIETRGADSRELFRALFDAHGTVFRAFRTPDLNTARLSPNTFNTESELDRTFERMEAHAH